MLNRNDVDQLMLAGQAKLTAWEEEFQRLYYGRPAEPAAGDRDSGAVSGREAERWVREWDGGGN